MAALLVIYDLNRRGQNYDCIAKKLESYPTHWRFQLSSWVVQTNKSEEELATELIPCLDENDRLFVTRIAETSAWVGYTQQGTDWLIAVI